MRNEVISLKRSIDAHEEREILLERAVNVVLFALESVRRHNSEVPGTLPQPRLGEVVARLKQGPTPSALEESRTELEVGLRRLMEANRWQESEIREIVKALAAATASLTDRSTHYSQRLTGLATDLEELASTNDLLLLRVKVQSHAAEFRQCIEQMHAEQSGGLERLNMEMKEFRERLRRVEELSTIDALTGLANRQTAEARMASRIRENLPFSIVLFDLNRFKGINDRFGHLAGDAALREFGTRLKGSVRDRDLASRWGGDEFLVLVQAAMPDAMVVSRRLHQAVCGRYSLTVNSATVRLDVTASVGLAEYRCGETIEQLFARADAGLYEAKGRG
jgi:diguanylate cyclase (GGDEF)-like protein